MIFVKKSLFFIKSIKFALYLLTLNNISMKRFRLLLVALATLSFTAFYACGGETNDETVEDSTEIVDEPEVIEEETVVPDSTEVMADSTDMEATEEEVVEEETK